MTSSSFEHHASMRRYRGVCSLQCLRGLFSGKAERVSAELEHAEQVMLEHEKQNFSDKPTKHHKDKGADKLDNGQEKYSALHDPFDVIKSHEELPPGLHKVYFVTRPKCWMS